MNSRTLLQRFSPKHDAPFAMGGSPALERPSLDRLKALDGLPNVEAQLQSAWQLCTHWSRAEMTLRWLLGKLKIASELRQKAEAWDLLCTGIRFLSPQRVAFLLSQNGFNQALQSILSDSELSLDALAAVSRTIHLLIDLSRNEDGTSIRCVLMIDSYLAATICGQWLQHVFRHCNGKTGVHNVAVERSVLDPALRLWDMRKKMDEDDKNFNESCMVPALLLLSQLRDEPQVKSLKRKRPDMDFTIRGYRQSLESLIARHTIIPARTRFFKKDAVASRRTLANGASQQPGIKEILGPLKMMVLSDPLRNALNTVPLILEIALRSTSTPTPRHRLAERPWIEEVFSALRSCFASQERGWVNFTISAMIDVLRQHGAALSPSILSEMIKDQGLSEKRNGYHTDWKLIGEIIQLDTAAVNDKALVNSVFEAVTRELQERQYDEYDNFRTGCSVKNSVVIPIMKTYARSRNLRAFIKMWEGQLIDCQKLEYPSMWGDLDEAFAALLEDSLPTQQISVLLDELVAEVNAFNVKREKESISSEDGYKLYADLTVLDAVLRGIRSDELKSKFYRSVDALLQILLQIADKHASGGLHTTSRPYWKAITQATLLWFPFWAANKERALISRYGVSLFSGNTFKQALSGFRATEEDGIPDAALMYIAVLCYHFEPFDENGSLAGTFQSAIERFGLRQDGIRPVLTAFPGLMSRLQPQTRRDIFSSAIEMAAGLRRISDYTIQPILAVYQGSSSQDVLQDLASVCLEHLKSKISRSNDGWPSVVAMAVVATLEALALQADLCDQILDTLTTLPPIEGNELGSLHPQLRLAAIIRMLGARRLQCSLVSSASPIWDLAAQFNATKQDDILALFEEVVRLVLNSWIATQDKKQSRQAILELSKCIREYIRGPCKKGELNTHPASTRILMISVSELEKSSHAELKSEMEHRESKNMYLYWKQLLKDAKAQLPVLEGSQSQVENVSQLPHLRLSLRALATLPGSWISDLGDEASRLCQDVLEITKRRASDALDESILVAAFQIACKQAGNENGDLTSLAVKCLTHISDPVSHHAVLVAYDEGLAKATLEVRLAAITKWDQDALMRSHPALLLLRGATKSLSRDEIESKGIHVALDLLSRVLHVAAKGRNVQIRRTAVQTLVEWVKFKPFLFNQYGIEQTLATMEKLVEAPKYESELYVDVCNVFAALLTQHRSRLLGRFHLLMACFQALITCLFQGGSGNAVRRAHSLARLLESFCNPVVRPKKNSSALVDEARKAQAYAGQYARYILHNYCSAVLTGTLGEGVRDALLQGLWAVIKAIEINNAEGIKSLSAAMNNSERAVLRSLYDDYKRSGKWEGL